MKLTEITAKFQALNPYDPDEVPDLLNLTDDNYVCKCSHELKSEHDEAGICEVRGCKCKAKKKVRRQLWGVGIAAKRYTLFEKILDRTGKFIRHQNRQSQSPRHRLPVSAEKQPEELEKRRATVGLRDVGLHRARISGIEAQTTRLGFPPANDALLRIYLERAQDAGNVGWRTPPQFHVHGDDLRDVLV